MNVPRSMERQLEKQGWVRVLIPRHGDRVEMVDPSKTCLAPTQHEACLLDKGHKGYHSLAVFLCSLCGKMRRLPWHASNDQGEVACWICVRGGRRGNIARRRDA